MKLWYKNSWHEGETAYIIGKGPSLERLQSTHILNNGPVFAINSAIEKVETLGLENKIYSVQKDKLCSPYLPTTTLLAHKHESAKQLVQKNYPNVYVFNNFSLGLRMYDFSALTCIRLAQQCGCVEFCFVCFDSCTMEDYNVWGGAKDIAHSVNYRKQCILMKPYLDKIKHYWITP